MAIHNYFKRVDDDNLPDLFGSLSSKVLSKTIVEMNEQIQEVLVGASKALVTGSVHCKLSGTSHALV